MSRRAFIRTLQAVPLLLRASALSLGETGGPPELSFADVRHAPRYPVKSTLDAVLRLVAPGSDEYTEERYAFEIGTILTEWGRAFREGGTKTLGRFLERDMQGSPLIPVDETRLRSGGGLECVRRSFGHGVERGADRFLAALEGWIGHGRQVERIDFEITSIEETVRSPLTLRLRVRYDMLAKGEQRIGTWVTDWVQGGSKDWTVQRWQAETEMASRVNGPGFVDVTEKALGGNASYTQQMLRGSDYWRTTLDGACGIDVYGNNGVAVGDYDNDGFDDLYVSQPAGLPNRLYRNRGDGTLDDVTEQAGVGVLDNTSCALFADFRNIGVQDLLVVCGSGPLLFLNQGDGTFKIKQDAFRFARTPQGTFTHAAVSDYDRDGRLDVYFCLYSYYLGLDQYHYPVPYFDARNGPPNFLLHNEGDGTFVDRTEAAGLNVENDRYSFACAWGESAGVGAPDLYVVNDFGRNNLYRNNGDGTFTAASTKSHVEDVGAGMSACWADYNNDGRPDLYVANMWSAAGQRVSQQPRFHAGTRGATRELYRRHAQGNALYRNEGATGFRNVGQEAGVDVGRWAWGSDLWDFDHDGYADIYVTNGYISAPGAAREHDLGSFFWRQIVAKSPDDSTPSVAYEHGWNAINELIRSDRSWSGFERNALFANNRDGTFSEVSGVVGLDLLEDGRSFALADLDHDGRLEVVVKNRNAPQLRILHNAMQEIGDSIAFRLRGTKSNRDGIGTAITVEAGDLHQTKYLQAGSGFLAQHSKDVFFGIGRSTQTIRATVLWPSGLKQQFDALPRNHFIHLEEGISTVTAKAFNPSPAIYSHPAPERSVAQIPPADSVETWLLDPLKAPAFSLPDLTGNLQSLQSFNGSVTLLHFWSTASTTGTKQLASLDRNRSASIKILSVNIDPPEALDNARAVAKKESLSFPVVFATEQVAGVYNIIYRYLFDRRRDLPIPTSFLLDRDGMIVKVYQGLLTPERLADDARSIPTTPADRIQKALPFPGKLYQSEFSRNDYTYGVAMFQHGYLEQAEESFRQVVATKPDDAEGFYNLGTLNLRKKDFVQARAYLQRTLTLKPNYPEAWNNLGMMAAQEGHADEAIRNFQQSLELRPDYATALLNLGNVYRRQGDTTKASDTLTRALNLEPDDPEANYSLGMFHAQQDQLDKARVYLQRAIDVRPDYPEALNNLGVLLVRQQNDAAAEQQFKACIRVSPTFEQAYVNLARIYIGQHDKAKAKAALQDLLRVRPESAAARQSLQAVDAMP